MWLLKAHLICGTWEPSEHRIIWLKPKWYQSETIWHDDNDWSSSCFHLCLSLENTSFCCILMEKHDFHFTMSNPWCHPSSIIQTSRWINSTTSWPSRGQRSNYGVWSCVFVFMSLIWHWPSTHWHAIWFKIESWGRCFFFRTLGKMIYWKFAAKNGSVLQADWCSILSISSTVYSRKVAEGKHQKPEMQVTAKLRILYIYTPKKQTAGTWKYLLGKEGTSTSTTILGFHVCFRVCLLRIHFMDIKFYLKCWHIHIESIESNTSY